QKLSLIEEIEYRQKISDNYWEKNYSIKTTIVKNEDDGRFSIVIKNFPHESKSFTISFNNAVTYISGTIDSIPGTDIIFTPRNLKNTLIKDVVSISIVSAARVKVKNPSKPNSNIFMWRNFGELIIKFINNNPNNKSFLINDNGMLIESYSSITFTQNKLSVKVLVDKSIIKIFPKKLITGIHNQEMFVIQNISRTKLPLITVNTIEGLKLSGTAKKIKAIFKKTSDDNSLDLIKGIVGNVSFDENTYYDFNEDKTHIGIGVNSNKGYVIPYRFQGDIIPILNINIASLNNILIGFSNPIKNPYFDKESGIIKLKILESKILYEDNYIEKNIILNKYFADIISGNLSFQDIINLGKNE
ncbi:MAG: MHO_1580 family protein, partial [Metamycoplasmataceae bacterium]